MASASIFVAAKRQLVAGLQARLPTVQVDYAFLRGRALDAGKTVGEHIWLENQPQLQTSATPLMTGWSRHPREEVFNVDVVCQVADGGKEPASPDVVEERALLFVQELDDMLAAPEQAGVIQGKTLGQLDGLKEALFTGYRPADPESSGKGWAFRFVAEVQFSTYLT